MLRRFFDIAFSGVLLVLAAPALLVTAVAVSLDGGPVFYRQTRAGIEGRPFGILKFRSMKPNNFTTAELAVFHGQVTSPHPEVTPIGRLIRRYKIDEFPQLINVLRGEMSIVGPRPTVLEQVQEYTPFQWRRLTVLPGLTGWAQVNGGIEFDWPERILLDVWYVANRSPWLDAAILCRTVMVILFGERRKPNALAIAQQYACNQLSPMGKNSDQESRTAELDRTAERK
jgi:sugar transferase EpsL